MRLVVEFKRFGPARYISHLDMQRNVMRAVRRTNLKPEYSSGFNPHMILSFASAMPVGLVSDSEYLELRLLEERNLEECLTELKHAFPEGIEPVWTGKLKEDAQKLMAALKFATYTVDLSNLKNPEDLKKCIANLMQSDMIEIENRKDGKSFRKNIRPLINSITLSDDGARLDLSLSFSSEGSLNPELLLRYIADESKLPLEYELKRTGLFTLRNGNLIPLRELCD